jgi:hypothetical protein
MLCVQIKALIRHDIYQELCEFGKNRDMTPGELIEWLWMHKTTTVTPVENTDSDG